MFSLPKAVICPKCGWNHCGVDRDYAEQQSIEFQKYYDSLTDEKKVTYYGKTPHTIEVQMRQYEHCFRCGNNYKNLENKDKYTSPVGSTLQPIIFPDQ